MEKVSIIIPVYNQAQWLPDAVNSTNQTVSCEIIIVNDGSTDNTDEVAKQFDVDKYIVKENGGLYHQHATLELKKQQENGY